MNRDRVPHPVLVIGGTRGTGKEIVSRLLRDDYPVRVVARNVVAARALLGADIEIVHGDVTKPETLRPAFAGALHVIFTAGVTKRPANERSVIAVEYEGVKNTLSAARETGFAGRLLYMTAIGVTRHSVASIALNLVKGNTLNWRRRAEEEIRRSGVDYTIVRCGVLTNAAALRGVELSQRDLRMSLRRRISRSDAAELFVQAMRYSSTSRTTFEAVSSRHAAREPWEALFARLRADSAPLAASPFKSLATPSPDPRA